MSILSDKISGFDGPNPFSDSQARNFSDLKVFHEFCPISNFWSLFNDQHEILLGTRGSGKTFLLKMMRYSMLKRINDPKAVQIIKEKKFIALYLPMYLEFVTHLTGVDQERQIGLFQFAFNCLLAKSLLIELPELLEDIPDEIEKRRTELHLARELGTIWLEAPTKTIMGLSSLSAKISQLFFCFDVKNDNLDKLSAVFTRPIGASLLAVKTLISQTLSLTEEPTWLICIDEAEFLPEHLQKCINNVFRSDSHRVALKVATLPFSHSTLATLEPSITISPGNDFSYRVVDMGYDSNDFENLTNKLCSHRLQRTMIPAMNDVITVENFIGRIANDDMIDYYRKEFGETESTYEVIKEQIVSSFTQKRKKGSSTYPIERKTIYDKFAPIFFIRQMYKRSKEGNARPGWYAGSKMIRRIAQGNPRAFIQIMSSLFEKSRRGKLTPKAQHQVLLEHANAVCKSTQALEEFGSAAYKRLDEIATILQERAHGENLVDTGCSFILSYNFERDFCDAKKWLELSIAYTRLIVDDDVLIHGIKQDTKFMFSNTYAASYWLPMRSGSSPKKITLDAKDKINTYRVKIPSHATQSQISLFGGEN